MLNCQKISPNENRVVMTDVIKKFEEVIIVEQNEFFHRVQFNKRDQKPEENIESYMVILRNMAKS